MQADRASIVSGFLRSAQRYPGRPALQVGSETVNYEQLLGRAVQLAGALDVEAKPGVPPLTAVFAQRSVTAYAGVLASLLRGHGYVPLNPAFPIDRTRGMLSHSGCRSMIVDRFGAPHLDSLLADAQEQLFVILPEQHGTTELRARWPSHRFLSASDLREPANPVAVQAPSVGDDAIAYLLYTSGSTGQPKGVMVAHRNVAHFVRYMVERYDVTEADRFSQTFDLTFDLSAFDMFVAWERGACVCCPTQAQKLFPAQYIADSGITVWFSVPSTAVLMSRLRMLQPGKFPGLRLSLFCGEALPVEIMQAWERSAPNSVLENLYGPTELTIACTLYRWDPSLSPGQCENGLVPIGLAYPGMQVLVADENLCEVAPGETGELLMTGPQVSLGYYRDPARTAAAFVRPPGASEVYYRTGDRVRRVAPGQPMVYLGRMDHQIKVQGYRVELGEIEAALRQEAGVETAVAIGWPRTASGADGIVGFVGADDLDVEALRKRVMARLPPYMHPSHIRLIKTWPLNSNGKIDRGALRELLEGEAVAGAASR
jgi:amino acid adenylation domain-containing protein